MSRCSSARPRAWRAGRGNPILGEAERRHQRGFEIDGERGPTRWSSRRPAPGRSCSRKVARLSGVSTAQPLEDVGDDATRLEPPYTNGVVPDAPCHVASSLSLRRRDCARLFWNSRSDTSRRRAGSVARVWQSCDWTALTQLSTNCVVAGICGCLHRDQRPQVAQLPDGHVVASGLAARRPLVEQLSVVVGRGIERSEAELLVPLRQHRL